MDNQKLSEALQMSALLLDADNAGYLGHEESLTAQKAKVDFGVMCQSLALELLKTSDATKAKADLAFDVARLKASIAQSGSESEDGLAFSFLQDHVSEAIDREGSKSELWRQVSRLIWLLPSVFRWIVLAFFVGLAAFAAKDFLATKM